MKRLLIILFAIMLSAPAFAQDQKNLNIPNSVATPVDGAAFKLFPTQNMWSFLKLDTRNGRVWRVQFSINEDKYRFEDIVSYQKLAEGEDEKNGRFTLYPTQNFYNYILLDQIDGRCWQIQWGENPGIVRIY